MAIKKTKEKSLLSTQYGHDNTVRPGRLARARDCPVQIEKQVVAFYEPATGLSCCS